MKMEEKITGRQRVLNHKVRHPNDKNFRDPEMGTTWKKVQESTHENKEDVKLTLAWAAIYNTMEIGDVCPKCKRKGKQGKIIWKGETKHRPLHPRCNNGCLLIYTGEELMMAEEEE